MSSRPATLRPRASSALSIAAGECDAVRTKLTTTTRRHSGLWRTAWIPRPLSASERAAGESPGTGSRLWTGKSERPAESPSRARPRRNRRMRATRRQRRRSPSVRLSLTARSAACRSANEGGLQCARVSLSASSLATMEPDPPIIASGAPKPLASELTRMTFGSVTPVHRNDPPPPVPYGARFPRTLPESPGPACRRERVGRRADADSPASRRSEPHPRSPDTSHRRPPWVGVCDRPRSREVVFAAPPDRDA